MADRGQATSEGQVKTNNGAALIQKLGIGVIAAICIIAAGLFFIKNSHSAEKPPAEPVLYDLGEFVTNLAETSELKYVKTKVTIELSNKSLEKEVKNNEPLLRDCLISLFNSKTSNDVLNDRSKIRDDAIAQLNKHLNLGKVTNIYFSDLVMQ